MKETKPYWYHNTAYSIKPCFVCLDFPNLYKGRCQNSLPLTTNFSQNVTEPSRYTCCVYISQRGHQCFPACFGHPTVGNFDVFPNMPI